MTDLAKLVVRLEAQTAQYMAQLDAANKRLEKFNKSAGVSAAGIAKGLGLAVVGMAVAFGKMAYEAVEADDRLNKMSQKVGISTESLSRMQYAAKLSNVSLEDLSNGIVKLSKSAVSAAQGSDKAVSAFAAIGVNVKDANGQLKGTEELLLEVADKFSKYEDGAGKAALAQELFSRGGAELIPFLNQGRDGIKALMQEADKFGLTVSTKSAQAAEDFNDNLSRMHAIVEGLANQAAEQLLPTMSAMSERFIDAAKEGGALDFAAKALAVTLKVLVTAGIIVTSIFQQLGRIIYGAGAALWDIVHGKFKLAGQEMSDAFSDARDNVAGDMDTIAKVWADGVPKIESSAKKIKKAAKGILVFDDEKSIAAIKKLSEMNDNLMEQVKTFGLGDAAATEYRLTLGSLADDVAKAGPKGKELAKSIVAQADALERLQNIKSIQEIDAQIQSLTGHTVEAADAAFDLQNAVLKASLTRQNDANGLKQLEALKSLTTAQAKFNDLELQSENIRDRLQLSEDRIQRAQESGSISELDALSQTDEARQQAIVQLGVIADKQKEIAVASGNPEMIRGAQQAAAALEALGAQTDLVAKGIKTALESSIEEPLTNFISGTEKAQDAFKDFLGNLEKMVAQFVAKDLMRRLFDLGDSSSSSSGGGGGGFLGTAINFIAGLATRDSGGRGKPGQAYAIGTGAQPELFVPDSHGTFMPRDKWMGGGGMTVHNNFAIEAPRGTVSMETQQQMANSAMRGLERARRRNG
jgi:hypothetical protein